MNSISASKHIYCISIYHLVLVTLISDLKTMLSPGGGLGVALLDDQDRLTLSRCHLVTMVMVMAIMITMVMVIFMLQKEPRSNVILTC